MTKRDERLLRKLDRFLRGNDLVWIADEVASARPATIDEAMKIVEDLVIGRAKMANASLDALSELGATGAAIQQDDGTIMPIAPVDEKQARAVVDAIRKWVQP